MEVFEEKVLLSPDRCGRIAIVKRPDGLLCLYRHWHWPRERSDMPDAGPACWTTDYDARLYHDVEPLPGIYGSVEDAQAEARRLLGLDVS